jgi:hypothetical protein
MLLLLLACKDPTASEKTGEFLLAPVDLGAALTTSEDYDPSNGDGLGLALAAALPVFGDNPAWSTPYDVWELLMPEVVQDEGICPTREILADGYRWNAQCRSTDGYDFNGSAERIDDAEHSSFDVDIEVIGDVEGAMFDRVWMKGQLDQRRPTTGDVVQHLDINLHLQVSGYWEQRGPSDPRLQQWSDWAMSGSLEEHKDGTWIIDSAVDVGEVGGFSFSADQLQAADCPIELSGVAALSGAVTAAFSGCDACADLSGGIQACAP